MTAAAQYHLRIGALIAILYCVRLYGGEAVVPDSASPETTATPTEESNEIVPPESDNDTDTTGRAANAWANFKTLMAGTWKDIALFLGSVTLWAVVYSALGAVLGLFAGLAVYLLLRRRDCFKTPFAWHRYVAWLWPVLFAASCLLGFGYGGLFLGGGRTVQHGIRENYLLETVVSKLMVAVALEHTEYELTGDADAEEIRAAFRDSEELGRLVREDFRAGLGDKLRQKALERGGGVVEVALTGLVVEGIAYGIEKAEEELFTAEPRLVMAGFLIMAEGNPNLEAYQKQHPDANLPLAAFGAFFGKIREFVCSLIGSLVWPQIALGIGLGLGIPLLLLGLLRLGVWHAGRNPPALPAEQSP